MGYGSDMARDMRKAKANTEKVRKVIALWGGIALWPRRLTRGGFFLSVAPLEGDDVLRGGRVIGRRREGSTRTSRRI